MKDWRDRHPSVAHFEPLFAWEHLPPALQNVSMRFQQLAREMLLHLEDGPELSAGLRKLLEAKDCFVRQAALQLVRNSLRTTGRMPSAKVTSTEQREKAGE